MTPDSVKSSYARMIDRAGETVYIRRYTGVAPPRVATNYGVRARVVGYEPKDLVGNIQQGDRKVIILADDLAGTALTLPLLVSDKVVVRGKELAIIAPDDSTRRIAGVLIAYELQARG